MSVPWINECINGFFQWFKLKNIAGINTVWENVKIYHNSWLVCENRCSWNLQLTNTPFHVVSVYSEYKRVWVKATFTGNEGVSVSWFLYCLGRDAASAFASRRPPNETGGWHGSGLCERDHDPHALPPERDHHFHIQTGTLHLCYPLLRSGKLPWLAKPWILMHLIICWS